MNDFDYDIAQKKRVARGAYAHVNRKRGKCRLPSDYLTAAQRKEMNGAVKTYNITRPMPMDEFVQMPDDLKAEYFRNMQRFGGAATYLVDEMNASAGRIRREAEKIGVPFLHGCGNRKKWSEKLAEWHAPEATAAETADENQFSPPPTEGGRVELLHARLTIRGERESILQNLRLLMPDDCEITVEW
jgi:hypothetical protein